MVISGGLSGCAAFPIGAVEAPANPVIHHSATPPQTASPRIPITATAIPSLTVTDLPPSPTPTPRASLAPRAKEPSPTPLPQPFIIGYSVAERPLEVFHFGKGPDKRLIVAGIHGGYEWNTIALADQLIEYLSNHSALVPEEITLYILRSANPDGEARDHGSAGRANENNVDINRNFPANWAFDWNRCGCWNQLPISAGAYATSEPETAAIMKFVLTHQIEALVSYHSAALGIFAGGQPPHPESHDLAQSLAAVAPYTYPPPYDTGCEYTGQLTDWASAHNIAAVDIELSNHEDTDFPANLKILAAFLSWQAED